MRRFLLSYSRPASSESSRAAASASGAAKSAETTATPARPRSSSRPMFSREMPPMATTGMETASTTALRPSGPMGAAVSLVLVAKAAPEPM